MRNVGVDGYIEDEVELILAARDGDQAAFGRLFIRHQPLLLTLCRRVLEDTWQAEDAAQEAAIRAMLTLDRLRDVHQFGPWLAGIGFNVCREFVRAKEQRWWSLEALAGGRSLAEPVALDSDPALIAEERILAERVRTAVGGLPRGQRAAILLFYLRGLTQADTAAALGIEIGTVKTRLYKGRAGLRAALHVEWEELSMDTGEISLLDPEDVLVRVADVRRWRTETGGHQYTIMLEEIAGGRRMPIWVGSYEGESLARSLEQTTERRPLPYKLMLSLLQASRSIVREVRIARLAENTYFAEIVLEASGQMQRIDARASDALNLAVLAKAPIGVHRDVLREAAISPDKQPDRYFGAGTEGAAEIVAPMTDPTAAPCNPAAEAAQAKQE